MTYYLTCAECGEAFEASRSDALTCSGTCRNRRSDRRAQRRYAFGILSDVVGERRATELLAAM